MVSSEYRNLFSRLDVKKVLIIFLLYLAILPDFASPMEQLKSPYGRKVMVVAHRGASGYAPENTLAAVKLATEMKADMTEFDVYKSKDGVIVVMHDETVNRTTNGKGKIEEMTLKELQTLDAGSKYDKKFAGEKIPTLEEIIKLAKGKILLNIEIKGAGCEKGIVGLVKKYGMQDKVLVSSFHHEYLQTVKELNPDIRTGALVNFSPDIQKIVSEIKADALNIMWLGFNEKVFKEAKDNGLAVFVWTVNDETGMKKMVEAGVDGIITNYPDRAVSVLEGKTRDQ